MNACFSVEVSGLRRLPHGVADACASAGGGCMELSRLAGVGCAGAAGLAHAAAGRQAGRQGGRVAGERCRSEVRARFNPITWRGVHAMVSLV